MLINIIGFFYLISFTPFLTISITEDTGIQLFNTSFINYVGPGREIEYKLKYKNKTLHCEKYGCLPDDNIDDINEEKVDFGDVILLLFYSLLTCLIMYFNGESFSSDSKRINFLSSGKLSLEFKPIDIANSFCNREQVSSILNNIFCYRLTIFNISTLMNVFATIIFICRITILILGAEAPWVQAYFIFESEAEIWGASLGISFYCFACGVCWESCGQCKNRPPYCKKYCVIIALLITFLLFPFEIIGLPLMVGSQNGKIKYRADCKGIGPQLELYHSLCYEDYDNKYLIFNVKKISIDKLILIFVLGLIPNICTFYLIVLMICYVQRAIPEYGFVNRTYEAVLYLLENNGEKICVDDIEIECEPVKMIKNINGKEVEYNKNIHKRKIKPTHVPVDTDLPIIYI